MILWFYKFLILKLQILRRTHVNQCDDHKREHGPALLDRRRFLAAGLGFAAAAPLLMREAVGADAAQTSVAADNNRISARAYGATSATAPLGAMQIQRRAIRPNDVLLDVLYCGICHSDIHIVCSEWRPAKYPCVPGHEIIGRVAAVGSAVTKFKAGGIGGVGCMVNSCGTCENCQADREQNCPNGTTFTYDSNDRVAGGHTFGGYSDKIVVFDRFVIRIPPGMDLAATAPLLCAGITTFSPMQHWKLAAGQRVGVIGFGGLGHMAVKLAVARKAKVTVFTTSPGKIADARRMGARSHSVERHRGDEAARQSLRSADLHRSESFPNAALHGPAQARRHPRQCRRFGPTPRLEWNGDGIRPQKPCGVDDRRHRRDSGSRRLLRGAQHQGGY
jgi:alcohol dehydrogenase (NADP+)